MIAARDAAVGLGITINGLGSFFYTPHVTGGAGSFVLEASDFSTEVFGAAIRQKVITELPEPGTAALFGLVGLSLVARRRER